LSRIFSRKKWIKYTGQELDDAKVIAPTDYYVRNGNKVLLFESKEVLVDAKIKTSKNYELYETVLKEKFYFAKSDVIIKKKAILQLLNFIEILLDQRNTLDSNYKSQNLRFYPILLTHSSQFDTLGLNKILNKWFLEELIGIEKKRDIKIKVFPLTIINIDSLIYFEDHFRDTVDLYTVIEEYHRFTTFEEKKKYNSEVQLRISKEKMLIPFSTYFFNYMRDRKMLTPTSFIRDHGFKMLT
jgi:hypothetical protein